MEDAEPAQQTVLFKGLNATVHWSIVQVQEELYVWVDDFGDTSKPMAKQFFDAGFSADYQGLALKELINAVVEKTKAQEIPVTESDFVPLTTNAGPTLQKLFTAFMFKEVTKAETSIQIDYSKYKWLNERSILDKFKQINRGTIKLSTIGFEKISDILDLGISIKSGIFPYDFEIDKTPILDIVSYPLKELEDKQTIMILQTDAQDLDYRIRNLSQLNIISAFNKEDKMILADLSLSWRSPGASTCWHVGYFFADAENVQRFVHGTYSPLKPLPTEDEIKKVHI